MGHLLDQPLCQCSRTAGDGDVLVYRFRCLPFLRAGIPLLRIPPLDETDAVSGLDTALGRNLSLADCSGHWCPSHSYRCPGGSRIGTRQRERPCVTFGHCSNVRTGRDPTGWLLHSRRKPYGTHTYNLITNIFIYFQTHKAFRESQ